MIERDVTDALAVDVLLAARGRDQAVADELLAAV
jgi:hypothetical protein